MFIIQSIWGGAGDLEDRTLKNLGYYLYLCRKALVNSSFFVALFPSLIIVIFVFKGLLWLLFLLVMVSTWIFVQGRAINKSRSFLLTFIGSVDKEKNEDVLLVLKNMKVCSYWQVLAFYSVVFSPVGLCASVYFFLLYRKLRVFYEERSSSKGKGFDIENDLFKDYLDSGKFPRDY